SRRAGSPHRGTGRQSQCKGVGRTILSVAFEAVETDRIVRPTVPMRLMCHVKLDSPMPENLTPELRDLLTVRLVPGLGPRLTAALLDRFGTAGGVLRASPAQLREIPHIGEK